MAVETGLPSIPTLQESEGALGSFEGDAYLKLLPGGWVLIWGTEHIREQRNTVSTQLFWLKHKMRMQGPPYLKTKHGPPSTL